MGEDLMKAAEEQPEQEKDTTGCATVTFQNKQDDLMKAIEVIDRMNRDGTRRTIHLMAVVLVLYWSVDLIRTEPTYLMGWVMLAAAIALGIFVWREPRASNLKYTARYVERAPQVKATVDREGVRFEDGGGTSSFSHADGVKIYEYENILALDGGKKRFGMIPLDQLDEADRSTVLYLLQKENYQKVEPKPAGGGFFHKK